MFPALPEMEDLSVLSSWDQTLMITLLKVNLLEGHYKYDKLYLKLECSQQVTTFHAVFIAVLFQT